MSSRSNQLYDDSGGVWVKQTESQQQQPPFREEALRHSLSLSVDSISPHAASLSLIFNG